MRKEEYSRGIAQTKASCHEGAWHVWAKAVCLELQELWPERCAGTTRECPAVARSNLFPMLVSGLSVSQFPYKVHML